MADLQSVATKIQDADDETARALGKPTDAEVMAAKDAALTAAQTQITTLQAQVTALKTKIANAQANLA